MGIANDSFCVIAAPQTVATTMMMAVQPMLRNKNAPLTTIAIVLDGVL